MRGWGRKGLGTGARGRGREAAKAVDVDYALLYGEDRSTAVVRVRKLASPSPGRLHDMRIWHPAYRLRDR
jgi:hypothetical protein